jgi:ABC-type phosphate transport system substrate-binding protein
MWSSVFGMVAMLGCLLSHPSGAEEPAGLVVIVHISSPVHVLSANDLRAVFTRVLRNWPDGTPVTAINFAPGVLERAVFDRVVLGMDPDDVAEFWVDQMIRGDSPPPRQLSSAAAIVDLVSRTPGAIGYIPESKLRPRVKVVARIRRNQVVMP